MEKFDLYLLNKHNRCTFVYHGTVIGSKKIIPVGKKAARAILVIRQSRSTPILQSVGFYA